MAPLLATILFAVYPGTFWNAPTFQKLWTFDTTAHCEQAVKSFKDASRDSNFKMICIDGVVVNR